MLGFAKENIFVCLWSVVSKGDILDNNGILVQAAKCPIRGIYLILDIHWSYGWSCKLCQPGNLFHFRHPWVIWLKLQNVPARESISFKTSWSYGWSCKLCQLGNLILDINWSYGWSCQLCQQGNLSHFRHPLVIQLKLPNVKAEESISF